MANHPSGSDADSVLFSLDALIQRDEPPPRPIASSSVESNQIRIGELTAPELPMLQPLFDLSNSEQAAEPPAARWLVRGPWPIVLLAGGLASVLVAALWHGGKANDEPRSVPVRPPPYHATGVPAPSSPEPVRRSGPPEPNSLVPTQREPTQAESTAPQGALLFQRNQRSDQSSSEPPKPPARTKLRPDRQSAAAPPRNARDNSAKPGKCECKQQDLMCAMRCATQR